MPELPEVEVTKRGIEPFVTGYKISQLILRQPKLRWPIPEKLLMRNIQGNTVENITRRGKYLLFELSTGTFAVHLGMSGYLRVLPEYTKPQKHDHIDWMFSSGRILRLNDARRFGAVLWLGQDPLAHPLLKDLGVEPLTKAFDAEYLIQKAKGRSIVVKNFIMDQKIVVGVGNIYANEALFQTNIHPLRLASTLTQPEWQQLSQNIKRLLKKAITRGGTTLKDFSNVDGKPGYFSQQLLVYGKEDTPCPVCAAPIQCERVGQRSTFFCDHCQQ